MVINREMGKANDKLILVEGLLADLSKNPPPKR
jgi:hypothetical protein